MIQFKLPSQGVGMKAAGGGEVFMNPQRDIAHAFSGYILRTFEIVSNDDSVLMKWYYENGGTEEGLVEAARFFRKFLEVTQTEVDVAYLHEAAAKAGFKELPLPTRLVVGHALMQVNISAFFHGFREAVSQKTDPSIELELPAPSWWITKMLRRLFRACLYAVS